MQNPEAKPAQTQPVELNNDQLDEPAGGRCARAADPLDPPPPPGPGPVPIPYP
jgi:hypothetical protein